METNQTAQPNTQQPIQNKKMMNCKTCGAPMAKSAKKCQSCGAKNPRKRIKKLITFLVILAIVVGYPSYFIAKDRVSAKITTKNEEVLNRAELGKIYEEYLANDKYQEFLDEYLPAKVEVKGKITKINDTTVGVSSNGSNLNVEAGASNVYEIYLDTGDVYMIYYELYTDAEDYEFNKLKVGDKVVATGVITKSITVHDVYGDINDRISDLEIIGTETGIVKQ